MSRLPLVDVGQSEGVAREVLDRVQAQLGRVPNLYRAMANGPAALEGYLGFRAGLARGALSPRLREQLALLTAEENGCAYCVAAHTFRGRKVGLSADELRANRNARSEDERTAVALRFARAVITCRGDVPPDIFEAARAAGWSDGDLAEMVGHVALNIYSNYFNHVAQPELDFPPADGEP